ncbi:MAG: hypothetical protein J6S23_00855 [Clostridia bacterium]|nr:hypothetical protein [Clostridia bacterium]
MKKTVKILAVVMILAMISVMFVGCSKILSGKYVAEGDFMGLAGSKTVLEFSGKNVTRTVTTSNILTGESTKTSKGTYEIMKDNDNPDALIIAFEFEGEDRYTKSFSEGKNADGEKVITIGGIDFKQSK